MDSKGNLYTEIDGKLKNEKGEDVLKRPKNMQSLSNDEYLKARGMNRADRRKWFRDNKNKVKLK